MALNLFKRVDSVKGLFAVESISLIYNALTTIMVLILFPRMDHPVIMLSERAGIVAITFALIYLYRKYPCRKQKNTYITINQQCNYQIKNYSVYWLSIEGLNKFLYIINGGQFARIITFIEDRKGFLLFQNAP